MPLQKVYYLSLPLKNKDMSPVAVVVENDIGGNKFVITLTQDGKPFPLTGVSQVTVTCLKADGTAVVDAATVESEESGKISYVLHQQCLACLGIVKATVEVFSDEGATRITSTQFLFEVKGELNDGSAIPEQEEYPILQQFIIEYEEIRAAEAERVIAENSRDDAETLRITAESARASAESDRSDAESLRATAESNRAGAEAVRIVAEQARRDAESLRASAETTRGQAESGRASAESARAQAETARDSAEGLRAQAETARQNAESIRDQQETARQTAIGNLRHCGEYDSETTYQVRNVVSYQGASYMTIQSTTGNAPTDTAYWLPVALKGEKGAVLSPRGAYSASENYLVNDLVSYNGSVYYNVQSCTGIAPTNGEYWALLIQGGVGQHNALSGLNDGDYIHLTAAEKSAFDGAKHSKTARFVIGTSAGWTANDCDYLCDGTDDQAEINAAIQSLPASGGEIVILDGEYNITAPITVNKSNVSIKGNGRSTKLNRNWDSSTEEGVIDARSADGCIIEGLCIDGNNYGGFDSNKNHCIYVWGSNQSIIRHNICTQCSDTGINVESCYQCTIADNIVSFNDDTGIEVGYGSNNVIANNIILSGGDIGLYIHGCSDVVVTGNIISNAESCMSLYECNRGNISNNVCKNYDEEGLRLNSCVRCVIANNVCFLGNGTPADYTASQHTILLFDIGNEYNIISSNNCMGKAVTVEGGTGNSVINNKYNSTSDLEDLQEDFTSHLNDYATPHTYEDEGDDEDYIGVKYRLVFINGKPCAEVVEV